MAWDRRRRGFESGPFGFVTRNLSLAFFTVIAFGALIVARSRDGIFDDVRGVVSDASAPVMELVAGPAAEFKRWSEGFTSVFSIYEENQRLREENARLLAGQVELAELQRKNARYEELLKIPADEKVTSVTARVIADATAPFVRTLLVNAGRTQGLVKGQAVVDERGLLGRVITTGNRSARVLLLTDINSRIPVLIEGSNLKAIMVGDNSGQPTLEYLPPGSRITAGARIVTTPDGGVFPPGIAVGRVAASRTPRVKLFTSESHADFVRILSYTAPIDVDDVTPEPLPGATPPNEGAAPAVPGTPAAQPAASLTPGAAPTVAATRSRDG
jgi:rod shape-determining protein MreC